MNEAVGSLYATASSTTYSVTVESAMATIASCDGCEYVFPNETKYYRWSSNNSAGKPLSTRSDFATRNDTLYTDYTELVAAKNKNYFLGFKFDGSGNITNAYACGVKGTDYLNSVEQNLGVNAGTAFCIEGVLDNNNGGDSTTRANVNAINTTVLNDQTTGIWQGRCNITSSTYVANIQCNGSIKAYVDLMSGSVYVNEVGTNGSCGVTAYGDANCDSW